MRIAFRALISRTAPRAVIAACLAIVACASCLAEQLPPRDEAKKDPTLVAFRNRLLQAIAQKDTHYIESILSPRVEYALGGGVGKADFESQWNFKSKTSNAWNVLQQCVQRGGYFENDEKGRQFVAPYAAFDNIIYSDEGLETALITTADEPIYAQPDSKSKVVARLHYEFVVLPDDSKNTPASWTAIKFGKQRGFVRSAALIKQTDPYVTFKKIRGKWTLTWFGSAST
jgi:hypothetical protein